MLFMLYDCKCFMYVMYFILCYIYLPMTLKGFICAVIKFYSILFYSILFYSILFYSIKIFTSLNEIKLIFTPKT